MFHFERKVIVKHAADLPAATQFAVEVTSHFNKRYSMNMKAGVQLFGDPALCWDFDAESLDKLTQLHTSLMQDREYIQMLDKVKDRLVDGSLKDTIVTLIG